MAKICSLASCQNTMLQLLLFVNNICKEKQLTYWIDGGTLLGAVRHGGFIPWDDDIDICLLPSDYHKLIEELKIRCSQHDHYDLYYSVNGIDFWCEYLGDTRILAHGILSSRIDLVPVKSISDNDQSIIHDNSLANIARFFAKGAFKDESAVLSEHLNQYLGDLKKLAYRKEIFFKDYLAYLKANTSNEKDRLYTYSFNDMLVSKSRPYYTYDDIFPTTQVSFEGHLLSAPRNMDRYLRILYGDNYMTPPPKDKQQPFADVYLYNNLTKEKTSSNANIFLLREEKHFIARTKKNKMQWYREKLLTFIDLTYQCIKRKSFGFWVTHLKFILKKTISGGRF